MANKRIIILDDNLDILEMVQEALLYEDYEVKAISESIGVVALAESFKPDLLLLDYKLKDGNGADICKAFKSQPSLAHIPIIMFSAYTHPNIDFRESGCDDFIVKPFDLDVLTGTLSRYIL